MDVSKFDLWMQELTPGLASAAYFVPTRTPASFPCRANG
jgi:hypothetical protein